MGNNNFEKLFFVEKPIIGMIHLAGKDKVKRALDELILYQEEGVNGVIIEDYHGKDFDVYNTLKEAFKMNFKIVLGVNVLRSPYSAFELADKFNVKFIQFDSVQTPDLNLKRYNEIREKYPDVALFGGVGFKYTQPTGNPLRQDLDEGRKRCEAIVTTGEGTGIETPIEKLQDYKKILGNFPLIVGAGVNLDNIYNQLDICDGAIVGSYFKPQNNTYLPVDRKKVKDLMDVVREVRNYPT